MTCNIAATPLDIEPLPLYRRDPETSSLLSSAPSYTSEAPTYRSSTRDSQTIVPDQAQAQQRRQPQQPYYVSTSLLDISTPPPTRSRSTTTTTTDTEPSASTNNPGHDAVRPAFPRPNGRLPSPTYAPGFTSRAPVASAAGVWSDADALQNGYNIGAWSSVTASSHLQRRQYERVAMRRASRAAGVDRATALLESMKMGSGENPPSPVGGGAETSPSSAMERQDGDGSGGGGDGDGVGAWEAGTERLAAAPLDVGALAAADTTTAEVPAASLSASEPMLPLEDPALRGVSEA
ncbi:hypothetical protein SLS58_006203 [Diplodia intermedia]|uniref:Uncharacterized protein n=1 Tax=Diplodia intermedia TaxID=856260 RepID=A0ABR3TNW4_9PEZI